MVETENGFEVSVELKDYDTFNFCFRNNYNIWDNNFGFNYIAAIEDAKQTEENSIHKSNKLAQNLETEATSNTNSTKIIEDTIKEINNNIEKEIDTTISKIHENSDIVTNNFEIEKNKEPISNSNEFDNKIITNNESSTNKTIKDENKDENSENINETTNNIEKSNSSNDNTQENISQEFEKMFNELLDSILQSNKINNNETENSDINLENGFGLQSVDEIKELDSTDCEDDIFQELYENKTNETLNVKGETSNTSELEELLNNFSEKQEQTNNLQNNTLNLATKESEENSNNSNNENNISEENKLPNTENEFKISELPTLGSGSEDFFDKFIDKSYSLIQKAWDGCKKIGLLIKKKAKNLLSEEK